jgi:hypothetical protein
MVEGTKPNNKKEALMAKEKETTLLEIPAINKSGFILERIKVTATYIKEKPTKPQKLKDSKEK